MKNVMEKCLAYANENKTTLLNQYNDEMSLWENDNDYVVNDVGYDTFDEWKQFCQMQMAEYILCNENVCSRDDEMGLKLRSRFDILYNIVDVVLGKNNNVIR